MKSPNYRKIIASLRAHTMPHRNFVEARAALQAHVALAVPGSVIALVGPTNAGKSYVRRDLRRTLLGNDEPRKGHDIPMIVVEAANAHDGLFTMKHFTIRALEEIAHPILGDMGGLKDPQSYIPRIRMSETVLRIALEKGLKHRRTRFLVVDEAAHLTIGRSERRSAEVLDSLKCLGNTTDVILILIGGYELLPHLFTSAHFCGRLRLINFPEYRDTKRDREEFDRILQTLSPMLPLERGSSLLEYSDSLFAGSVGLYGLLIRWLEAGVCAMMAERSHVMTSRHLSSTRLEAQINLVQKEIHDAGKLLSRASVKRDDQEDALQDPPRGKKKERRPFQRTLGRDRVGTGGKDKDEAHE